MSIKGSLLSIPEREDGGRTAYDRFDYQTAWGLSRLLELHKEGQNYAVAFEFHDDVICLDDADEPTSATFYQIKTKASGDWSFAQITSRPSSKDGKKKSSFAGKMHDNLIRFGAVVEKLAFVSNQPLPDLIVVHGEKDFSAAKEKELKKFVAALLSESSGFKDPEHTSLFFFIFSDLNLSNYEDTVVGRIASFLQDQIGSHVPARPFALTLNDYCRRRSKSLADVANFAQLKASKFITRADMLKWLSQAQSQHERRPEWSAVAVDLPDMAFSEKVKLEREWRAYDLDLRSRANASMVAFTDRVRVIIDAHIDAADSLGGLVAAVLDEVRLQVLAWKPNATDLYVRAVILYEFKR